MGRMVLLFFGVMLLNLGKAAAQLHLQSFSDSLPQPLSIRILPQNFYNKQHVFFCRKELQLQRLTALPIFIRLGAKEYVDYLEQKPNAVWRPK